MPERPKGADCKSVSNITLVRIQPHPPVNISYILDKYWMTKNANRKKYHYIYKTTCLVTGKYYLGMHSTDKLDDGYIGSGKRLWYSINKHGKENHVCEILEHYFTREWLREREAELVNAETLVDPMCMNLKVGGEGGFDKINELGLNIANLQSQKAKSRGKEARSSDPRFAKIGENLKKYSSIGGKESVRKFAEKNDGKTFFELMGTDVEFQELRKKRFAEIQHQQGSKNSQFGKCWIFSIENKICKKIDVEEIEKYIQDGWIRGRKVF